MMKTITQYRPLIFAEMEAQAVQRTERRRRWLVEAAMIAGYTVAGLGLFWETGVAPWEWQFWTCLGPLMVSCELIGFALAQSGAGALEESAPSSAAEELLPAPATCSR